MHSVPVGQQMVGGPAQPIHTCAWLVLQIIVFEAIAPWGSTSGTQAGAAVEQSAAVVQELKHAQSAVE
jgi:hypothetical protein